MVAGLHPDPVGEGAEQQQQGALHLEAEGGGEVGCGCQQRGHWWVRVVLVVVPARWVCLVQVGSELAGVQMVEGAVGSLAEAVA
jgi:hypothetical protein